MSGEEGGGGGGGGSGVFASGIGLLRLESIDFVKVWVFVCEICGLGCMCVYRYICVCEWLVIPFTVGISWFVPYYQKSFGFPSTTLSPHTRYTLSLSHTQSHTHTQDERDTTHDEEFLLLLSLYSGVRCSTRKVPSVPEGAYFCLNLHNSSDEKSGGSFGSLGYLPVQ